MRLFVDTSALLANFDADRPRHAEFEIMRRHGIRDALALDSDFARQGFRLLPSSPA